MVRHYRIAGIGIQVSVPDDWMYRDERELAPFVHEPVTADWELDVRTTEELPEPEGELIFRESGKRIYYHQDQEIRYIGSVEQGWQNAYLWACCRENRVQTLVKQDELRDVITPKVVMNSLCAEHMIAKHDGFLLHASYILHNGRAILFTAPSGTGKSTQADLWCRLRGAELINGDRAAVRVGENEINAWGIPFSGSSGVGKNAVAPLGAIVYLSQAPVTTISRLKGFRAFRQVWEGCCVNAWNRADLEKCTQTVTTAVSRVPVFHLACTPDESAVVALEEALKKQR